ncbi:MAG: hypothetical protein F6K22_34595 [Okeania sp. SIO2F4]|uniref:hypothetical protein n=1 Tax=Okeania sp. SIO2F4 TaxID=2607790 RepID=UPI001429E83D|nr:hypothetical protein [Okeania sp. SIO2F4]NES07477.1 hypothetical protein [Okeania sp. SIO2F4]
MSKIIVLPSYLNLPKLSRFTLTFLISLSIGLISTANAQEQDYSKPAERKIKVPFFEEERKLDADDAFSSFSNTFLNDALGGTGDPMGGATVPGSDFTMSPNVTNSEFADPSRGLSNGRTGMGGGDRPSVSPAPVSPTPITGGGGRGIFQNLPPR